MKIGGVTGWLRAAALCAEVGLPVSSHLFPEASAHLLAVTPGAHWLEWLDLTADLLIDPPRPVAGLVTARGPGLGLEWNETTVARWSV
jgi:mandelate racemase